MGGGSPLCFAPDPLCFENPACLPRQSPKLFSMKPKRVSLRWNVPIRGLDRLRNHSAFVHQFVDSSVKVSPNVYGAKKTHTFPPHPPSLGFDLVLVDESESGCGRCCNYGTMVNFMTQAKKDKSARFTIYFHTCIYQEIPPLIRASDLQEAENSTRKAVILFICFIYYG